MQLVLWLGGRRARCAAASPALLHVVSVHGMRTHLCVHGSGTSAPHRPQSGPKQPPRLSGPTLGSCAGRVPAVRSRPAPASHTPLSTSSKTAENGRGWVGVHPHGRALAVLSSSFGRPRQRETHFLDVLVASMSLGTYTVPPRGVRGYIYVGQGCDLYSAFDSRTVACSGQ